MRRLAAEFNTPALCYAHYRREGVDHTGYQAMAKATTIKVKLASTADTGYFYVAKKNTRTMTEKMSMNKYDPVARKHVEFKEAKIK